MSIFRRAAKPGPWYSEYQQDWREAHPHGQMPGSFYLGDVWVSSTLSWDEQWFADRGWRMPRIRTESPR